MTTPDEIATMVREEVARQTSGLAPERARCNTDFPHDGIVFVRGPNVYLCPCGQRYRKDGQGGLQEVT